MRVFALLVLFAAPCASQGEYTGPSGDALINDAAFVDRLNAARNSTWIAAPQSYFEGMTYDDARVLLGTFPSDISEHKTLPDSVYQGILDDDLPFDFDSRTRWPGLIHPVRDQQKCGSCWAFSASEVLSDRVAIASGRPSPVLSTEDLVSCDKGDEGCGGGRLPNAWKYLTSTGIVTDTCMPYGAGDGEAPKCRRKCADSEPFVRTMARSAYAINGPINMQKDMLMNGPIQIGFLVYPSFMNYKSGVYYTHIWEFMPLGGHAVKVLGWGLQNVTFLHFWHFQVPYWTVANSWGSEWGEEGYFRILRGWNHCEMETMGPPYAGLPELAAGEDLIV